MLKRLIVMLLSFFWMNASNAQSDKTPFLIGATQMNTLLGDHQGKTISIDFSLPIDSFSRITLSYQRLRPVTIRKKSTTYVMNHINLTYSHVLQQYNRFQLVGYGGIGLGKSKSETTHASGQIEEQSNLAFPISVYVEGQYPVFDWLQLKAGIGGRYVTGNDATSLSGAVYSAGFAISLKKVYEVVKGSLDET